MPAVHNAITQTNEGSTMTIPAADYVTYILSAERAHLSAEQNGFRTLDLKRDLGRMFATGGLVSVMEVAG